MATDIKTWTLHSGPSTPGRTFGDDVGLCPETAKDDTQGPLLMVTVSDLEVIC